MVSQIVMVVGRRCSACARRPPLRQAYGATVPLDRVDADDPLLTVEQGAEIAARGGVTELLDEIARWHRDVAHRVEALTDLDDLMEVRIGAGEQLEIATALARYSAFVFQVQRLSLIHI